MTRFDNVRERFGFSMKETRRAIELADERFDGDDLLGALYVHASQFAVNVRHNRDQWNENYARRHADYWRERFPA